MRFRDFLLPPFLDFEGDVCEVTFWAPSDVDTQGFTSVLHVLVPLVLVEQKTIAPEQPQKVLMECSKTGHS